MKKMLLIVNQARESDGISLTFNRSICLLSYMMQTMQMTYTNMTDRYGGITTKRLCLSQKGSKIFKNKTQKKHRNI